MFNRSVNKVVLVGDLWKDPEMRYMPNGSAVANLGLVTRESWKDKQTGERQERSEWHNLTVFGRLGEMCGEYLKKGAKIYIEGRLQTRKWQDKNTGQDRYSTDIIVAEIQLVSDPRNQAAQGQFQQNAPQQGAPTQQSWGNAPQQSAAQPPAQPAAPQMAPAYQQPAPAAPQQARPASQPPAQPAKQEAPQYNEPPMDFDDDIPF